MMRTFKAARGTEFFFDPTLEGEIWITADGRTVTVPAADLLDFAAEAAKASPPGAPFSQSELDLLMRILDGCGVFDPRQSREVTRARIDSWLKEKKPG